MTNVEKLLFSSGGDLVMELVLLNWYVYWLIFTTEFF